MERTPWTWDYEDGATTPYYHFFNFDESHVFTIVAPQTPENDKEAQELVNYMNKLLEYAEKGGYEG